MFVYFPVLAHVCDVKAYATWADLSRVLPFASEHGNAAAEHIQLFHSGGWFQIFAFLSPKNAVTMKTKDTSNKIFCRFYPQASSCKLGLKVHVKQIQQFSGSHTYFLKTCKKHSTIYNLILELGSQTVFHDFCVQDLMGGSENHANHGRVM